MRYVLRRLRGSPGFAIAAILTLAIAIGATASVFGLVDGVLLKPFPVRDADRVLAVWETNPTAGLPQFPMSPRGYLDYRDQNTVFSSVAASSGLTVTVSAKQQPERVPAVSVTPNYFATLGVTPVVGRFLASDSGGPDEVVVGYGYWRRQMGGVPSAIGKTLILDDRPYTVVGVMPPGLPGIAQLWTRLSFPGPVAQARGSHFLGVDARLKPGVTPDMAAADLKVIAARLARDYPQTNFGWSVYTIGFRDQALGRARPALIALLAAAACVLLIGAANIANLFLVRHLARERELAVRAALGASRRRIIGDLVLEATVLGLISCALGIAFAAGGVRALRALAPSTLPRLSDVGVDVRVVAFAITATMVTVLFFGVLPAWRISHGSLAATLKEGGRGTGSAQHHRLQSSLVVLQVAMALVLLTGAGLLVESFDHFQRMDPGFRPEGVLSAAIALPNQRYATPEQQGAFAKTALAQLAALPGVRAVSASSGVPNGQGSPLLAFEVVGQPKPDAAHLPAADLFCVTPDYFRTMGIPVTRGRGILATDDRKAREVVVVDERLAQRFLAGNDPLTQRLAFGDDTVPVVGVVAAIKQRGLADDNAPTMYAPVEQCQDPIAYVAIRTDGDPARLTPAIRRVFATLDPTIPVFDVRTMKQRVASTVGTTTFATFLASLFAVVALVLGVIGIYSVLAYVVAQRRREIGVRLALGASHGHVIGDIVRRALALTGVGIVLGSTAAWLVTRALASLFLGVSPHDPMVFIGAAAGFVAVALVASAIPALRATRVDPAVILT